MLLGLSIPKNWALSWKINSPALYSSNRMLAWVPYSHCRNMLTFLHTRESNSGGWWTTRTLLMQRSFLMVLRQRVSRPMNPSVAPLLSRIQPGTASTCSSLHTIRKGSCSSSEGAGSAASLPGFGERCLGDSVKGPRKTLFPLLRADSCRRAGERSGKGLSASQAGNPATPAKGCHLLQSPLRSQFSNKNTGY